MAGKAEQLFANDNYEVVEICRGDAGAVLINFASTPNKVKLDTTLPDGDYTDQVSGTAFKVKDGKLSGNLTPRTSYVLYRH